MCNFAKSFISSQVTPVTPVTRLIMQTLQRKKIKLDLTDLVNLYKDKKEDRDLSNENKTNVATHHKTKKIHNVFNGQNEIGNRFIDFLIRYIGKANLREFQLNAPTLQAYESEREMIRAIVENESKEKLNLLSKNFLKAHTHSIEFHNRSNWIENNLKIRVFTLNCNNKLFNGMICSKIQSWIIKAIIKKQNLTKPCNFK